MTRVGDGGGSWAVRGQGANSDSGAGHTSDVSAWAVGDRQRSRG